MAKAVEERVTTAVKAEGVSFTVDHEAIMNVLTTCSKVVPRSSVVPILKCIKFDLNKDVLFVTAMSDSQSVIVKLQVENTGNQDGSYLFPSREGIELVKRLPSGSLSFSVNEASVRISYGNNGSASLKVLDPDEYPQLPSVAGVKFVPVPMDALRKGAAAQRFASTDSSTAILCGINIRKVEDKLGFTATNRHRIYDFVSDVKIPNPDEFRGGVIDAINFKSIVDTFRTSERIDLAVTDHHLILRDRSSNSVYFGRLVEGSYPDIAKLCEMPEQSCLARIPLGRLDETLNRMLSLESENHRVYFLHGDNGELVVKSESHTGEIVESIEGSVVDKSMGMIRFNARYLRDALSASDRDVNDVLFNITGQSTPSYITYDGDPSVLNVVLPVR
ncbi:DNA polymerase III subunit beta [Paenibacillus sp. PDC88]|uniref:DNA polymerase III subunit beta n=1 Tax=Paenibacillus provencensis TaxID=441151 RepID=A0ABW3PVM4_9BACL|nr:DNA polymerase III subunit beta [Paenibacillus sp. PDC88]SDX63903.1 DNA polymerase-3 subunit beta [Paenibacillus sp. PDC88]